MTELMYIDYPDLFETSARITHQGHDPKGSYVILDQSLFYPQGGGQPADRGTITTANITYDIFDVRTIDGEVRHYISETDQSIDLGIDVAIKIDQTRRILNSKYHTAAHLIAAIVEKNNPDLKAIKGHQFPGEAFVEFNDEISNPDVFMADIAKNIEQIIATNAIVKTEELSPDDMVKIIDSLPYDLPTDKALRVCHIDGFSPVPCGGTHVKTLQDITSLIIKNCKSKKGKTKIFYEVE